MKLYNTLTRTLEEFQPLAPPKVTMYVCGPTVYDHPHIGHARSAFTFDVLHRYLKFSGYEVTFVRNVTDVDDKIIQKARDVAGGTGDLNATCREVAEMFLKSYHAALGRMGIGRPDREPKATEHVVPDPKNVELTGKIDASMTGYISRLLTQGAAYPSGGDVYFAVRKAAEYGKLSNRSVEELQSGARVEPGEQKQDPLDFALWKAAKPGEPSWPSPWGAGRPGWHIECTVMSTTYLGDAFDIHGGGVDLVFPHHENELAQARGLGKPFARYWVHNGLLTVRNEKMSKSLKNFITVDQAFNDAKGNPDVLKVFFLGAHYRTPIDYSPAAIRAAETRYRRMVNFFHRVANMDLSPAAGEAAASSGALDLKDEFVGAMDDDLNTPRALAALDGLVSYGYASNDPAHRMAASRQLLELGKTLGLFSTLVGSRLSDEQRDQLRKREDARQRQDFKAADEMRAAFAAQGLLIEDTPEGPVVLPK